MNPLTSLENFSPSSTAAVSRADATVGTADAGQRLVHGDCGAARTTIDAEPIGSMLPLSSTVRARMVAWPTAPTCHAYENTVGDGISAFCQVRPSQRDTATPATT